MFNIGKINTLKAFRKTDNGWILLNREADEVLLPNKFAPKTIEPGVTLQAFIYTDSEDRLVATTQTPKVMVDEFAYLKVKDANNIGVFLDWGLDKDLLLPFREQKERASAGEYCLVYVFLDKKSQRVVASGNMRKFIQPAPETLKVNEEVELLIADDIELGIRVIVNNAHFGLLFKNEIFDKLVPGSKIQGYVKKVREDGKVDVALQKQGIAAAKEVKDILLDKLVENKGFLKLNDDSKPEEIYAELGISKKNFKKAAGMLFKEGKIILEKSGIKLYKQ